MQRFLVVGLAVSLSVAVGACGDKDKDKQEKRAKDLAKKFDKLMSSGPKKQLEPPPKEAFKGKGRIINLYRDKDGKTMTVDVWAKRSFKYGPVELAKGVEFGKASDWFDVPEHQSVAVVPAGKGADAKTLGGIFGPREGDHITGIYTSSDRGGSIGNYWETTSDPKRKHMPKPPAAGKGQIVLRAGQLRSRKETKAGLKEKYGDAFHVGDGKGSCLKQRREADGEKPSVLGGTQPTHHEVPAGKNTISLHRWPSNKKCGDEPVYKFDVDVAAGQSVLVIIYSPDDKDLATLAVPMAVK